MTGAACLTAPRRAASDRWRVVNDGGSPVSARGPLQFVKVNLI